LKGTTGFRDHDEEWPSEGEARFAPTETDWGVQRGEAPWELFAPNPKSEERCSGTLPGV